MLNVLLAIHMIACVALVIAVMLQRSEGGALGMGGGGTGGLISGRGAAGVLVRVTMGLAAVFFTTSIVMTRLNTEDARAPTDVERQLQERAVDVFDPLAAPNEATPVAPAPDTTPAIDPLAPIDSAVPAPAPAIPAPAAPAPVRAPTAPSETTTSPAKPVPATTPEPATPN